MKNKKTCAAVLLAVAGIVSAQAASAAITSHSALACTGSTKFDGFALLFAAVSSQAPIGAVTKTYCPLTRPNATSAGDISSITVSIWDRSSEGGVSCRARSCDQRANACSWSATAGSSEPGEGKADLQLGSVASYSGGYAFIECSMDVVRSGPHEDYKIYSYSSND